MSTLFNTNNTFVEGTGLVDKQNGGNGQYARVDVEISTNMENPLENLVQSKVQGGSIPTEYMSAAIAGCRSALDQGPITGYPMVGILVSLVDGKSHAVDSSAQAFKEAGRLAVVDALTRAEKVLLEPVSLVEITIPSDCLGSVTGDISRRRGDIMDSTVQGMNATVTAKVPTAEILGYTTDLRSLTQGRGSFTQQPHGFEPAPKSVVEAVTGRSARAAE